MADKPLLEAQLADRPAHDALRDKNILHHDPRVAPSLHSAEDELNRRKTEATIADKLHPATRVSHGDLVSRGVARDRTAVAPTLQAAAEDLRHQLVTLSLKEEVGDRQGVSGWASPHGLCLTF